MARALCNAMTNDWSVHFIGPDGRGPFTHTFPNSLSALRHCVFVKIAMAPAADPFPLFLEYSEAGIRRSSVEDMASH